MSSNRTTLEVSAADVLRLIQAHLLEAGLSASAQTLQQESGVGLAGQLVSNYQFHASSGQWGSVLSSLALLDLERARLPLDLVAEAHEMAILELAEAGDLALAYSTYRLVQKQLEATDLVTSEGADGAGTDQGSSTTTVSRARILEQKLAALASVSSGVVDGKDTTVPADFYGKGTSRQERRDSIGRRLQEAVPVMPKHRLTTLLQQAIQWQTHTGQTPRVRRLWGLDENDAAAESGQGDLHRGVTRKRQRKEFDLVLGEALVDEIPIGTVLDSSLLPSEPIPSSPFATVKLGKKATPEAATFLPDGSGLVTGSSDGLIELWDASQRYSQLLPLPYQQQDALMGHDTAVTALCVSRDGELLASASSDGTIKVWRIGSGKCLRMWQAHHKSISCLALTPDASHLLTGSQDRLCREFGMRTTRVLKEFGHGSYLTYCNYVLQGNGRGEQLIVVTAGGDGAIRLWDHVSQEVLRVLRPISLGVALTATGSSIIADATTQASEQVAGAPAVHSVLPLHTPSSSMIVVPRGHRAFLIDFSGAVLRIFQDDSGTAAGQVFVAATVSSTNQWLYLIREDGICFVFRVATGKLETTIRDFGSETVRMPKHSSSAAEVSAVLHHPSKSILAAFSNHKSQKKGQVVLWK